MSYGNGAPADATSRRQDAREKAKAIREAQQKQEKRTRRIVLTTVLLFTFAILGIFALFLANSIRPAGPGPLNMRSDGILIGEKFVATRTPSIQPGQTPIPTVRDKSSDVISIQLYVDYFCPLCKAFEEANGDQISTWVNTGAATLEVHPITLLDRLSQGSKYSSRAANAAACVANFSPDTYFNFHTALFANQPKEDTSGLSNDELTTLAIKAKSKNTTSIRSCIDDQTFKTWVADAKDRALTGPIPNSNVDSVTGTPTVIVNGLAYTGLPNDAAAFSAFVVQAAGAKFNENSTPTPTPTPSEAPAG